MEILWIVSDLIGTFSVILFFFSLVQTTGMGSWQMAHAEQSVQMWVIVNAYLLSTCCLPVPFLRRYLSGKLLIVLQQLWK